LFTMLLMIPFLFQKVTQDIVSSSRQIERQIVIRPKHQNSSISSQYAAASKRAERATVAIRPTSKRNFPKKKHLSTCPTLPIQMMRSIYAAIESFGKRFNAASTSLWSTTTPLSEQRAFARSSEHKLSISIVPSLKSGRLESLSLQDISLQ
jgi:hypothetical protein